MRINAKAKTRREKARQHDGKFGSQPRPAAPVLNMKTIKQEPAAKKQEVPRRHLRDRKSTHNDLQASALVLENWMRETRQTEALKRLHNIIQVDPADAAGLEGYRTSPRHDMDVKAAGEFLHQYLHNSDSEDAEVFLAFEIEHPARHGEKVTMNALIEEYCATPPEERRTALGEHDTYWLQRFDSH